MAQARAKTAELELAQLLARQALGVVRQVVGEGLAAPLPGRARGPGAVLSLVIPTPWTSCS
ncbi:hypothetical protein KEF29_13585 [Streptomyces tuirus]|uniref:Uncharacterized protein n=1 Tax=Streptomyces tuirus TaxID=68278 RepID=A0A941FHB2_9ACTN|nr:hypothetical protein [Streptomyces tuirus]